MGKLFKRDSLTDNLYAQGLYNQRVNTGGSSYTTGGGTTFDADKAYSSGSWGYVGGGIYSTTDPISNTSDDALYQNERWGMSAYRFTVSNGSYNVILHFAELYYQQANKRIFDVRLEGTTVLNDYDIYANVGHDAAVQKSFAVNVSDGILDIEFSASADDPEITAIEVLASSPSNPQLAVNPTIMDFGSSQTSMTFTVSNSGDGTLNWNAAENPNESWIVSVSPGSGSLNAGQQTTVTVTVNRSGLADGSYNGTISVTSNGGNQDVVVNMTVSSQPSYVQRVNTGGSSFTTGSGTTFDADKAYSSGSWGYVEGNTYSTTDPIANTTDDALYQNERWGMSAYRFTVSNGSYQVILHFAELYYQQSGKRIFDVMLEGTTVLDNYDIYADVGHDAADQKSFIVNVADGILDIEFSASVDDPEVVAIEVIEGSSGTPLLAVNPTSLDFSNSQTSMTFTVSNSGDGTLNWNASENPDETWITSINPNSGSLNANEQDIVTVNISHDGLADGDYSGTISVTSNGGDQDVTVNMTVEIIPLTLLSLNGFEELPPGSTQEIRWMGADTAAYLSLKFSLDNGSNWTTISDSAINSGFYEWETPDLTSNNCLINIYYAQEEVSSDNLFKLASEPRIRVTYPNGGEWWKQGETHSIDWIADDFNGNVRIEYSLNNGSNWNIIENSYTCSNGENFYNWSIPDPINDSGECLIKVSDASDGYPFDECDATFGIVTTVYGRWHPELDFRPRILYLASEETAIRNRLIGTDVFQHLWNNDYFHRNDIDRINGIFQKANLEAGRREGLKVTTNERAQIAKSAAFVYTMNIDEAGNPLTNRDDYLNKAVQYLTEMNTQVWSNNERPIGDYVIKKSKKVFRWKWTFKFAVIAEWVTAYVWAAREYDNVEYLQYRIKELIQYCEAYDLLLGAGYSPNQDIEKKLIQFASNIYYMASLFADYIYDYPGFNNHRLMIAAALGVAAVTLNDAGSDHDINEDYSYETNRDISSYQPARWAEWSLEQTDDVIKSYCTDDIDRVYKEGPYYYRYAMMHSIPWFKAINNLIGDGYEFGYRSPWYDEDYIKTHEWITKIKMPDGRIPAYSDTYQDRYFPELAIRADSEHPYYSWPIQPFANLTGQTSPSTIEEDAAMFNFQLITAGYDTRIDYICAGNAPQQVPTDWNPSQVFSTGGDIVLRTGWDEDDTYLYIMAHTKDSDTYHSGYHRQDDQLSVILNYKGENVILDAAYISHSKRDSVNKDYNHSTILIDGEVPKCDVSDVSIEKTYLHDDFSYIQISSDYEPDNHKDVFREFVMINNSYFLVHDVTQNPGSSSKDYKLLLHGNNAFDFNSLSNGGVWITPTSQLRTHTFSTDPFSLDFSTAGEPISKHGDGYNRSVDRTVMELAVSNVLETEFSTVLYPSDHGQGAPVYSNNSTEYTSIFVDDRIRTNRYEFCLVNHTPGDINFYQEAFTPDDIIIHSIYTDADLLIMSFDENTREIKDCKVFVKGATYLTYRGIPFEIPSTEPQVLPQPELVNSDILSNETWSTMKYVTGSVTVNSGVTLTVDAGVGILFADNASLKINGTLNAAGTNHWGNCIVFTSSAYDPQKGDWSGVTLENAQSGCVMDYCQVMYATMGIQCRQCSPGLSNCEVSNCTNHGIYLYQAEPTIEDCNISDCQIGLYANDSYANDFMNTDFVNVGFISCTYGLFLYDSSPTLYCCNSIGNEWRLFCQELSKPTLSYCYFWENTKDGIRSIEDSAPYIYVVNPSYYGGHNTIFNNGQHGVSAYNSLPRLGYNQSPYPGNNSIYDNGGHQVHVDSHSPTQLVWAVYNYWNGQESDTTGDVRVSPVRLDPPTGATMSVVKIKNNILTSLNIEAPSCNLVSINKNTAYQIQNEEAKNYFYQGYQYQITGEYKLALGNFNYVIYHHPNSEYARLSMVQTGNTLLLSL